MKLSLVIPAYNEEKRIGETLDSVIPYLRKHQYDYEIIVVDDCSKDRTAVVVKEIQKKHQEKHLKILRNDPNRGKGYSVKRGMLAATKDYVLFSDADLATPIEELEKFLPYLDTYAVVIGSRALKGSDIRVKQPWYRVCMGKTFNFIVQIIAIRGIKDTQCGFKLFTRDTVQQVFPKQTFERFSFDVEVLFIAKKYGFKIKEVPVVWIDKAGSKVNPLKDSIRMFRDIITIRVNALRGKY